MKKIYFTFLFILVAGFAGAQNNISIVELLPLSPLCTCGYVNALFYSSGIYDTTNVYTLQLSDSSGNFNNAVDIGTLNGANNGGQVNISGTIPCNALPSSHYRVRVNSSNPAVTGIPDTGYVSINTATPVTPSVSISGPTGKVCGNNGILLNPIPVNGGSHCNVYWYDNGVPQSVYGDSVVIYLTSDTDKIMCVLYSGLGCITKLVDTSAIYSPDIYPLILSTTNETDALCSYNYGQIAVSVAPAGEFSYEVADIFTGGGILDTFRHFNPAPNSVYNLSLPPDDGYYVTIIDSNGCSTTDSAVFVASPTALTIYLEPFTATCNTAGVIYYLMEGGTPPYELQINNNPVMNNANNDTVYAGPAGFYNFMVIDSNGCSADSTTTIKDSADFTVSDIITNATCGNSNGSINLTPNDSSQYTYMWSDSATTQNLSSIAAGNYSVTVSDTGGCSLPLTYLVNNTNGPVLTATPVNITCHDSIGSIQLSVAGGSPPYTYSWDNGETTENATGLQAGDYYVTVTDHSGCAGYATAPIQEYDFNTFFAYINFTAAPQCSYSNGALLATAYGGIAPYTYLWSNAETTAADTGLAEGAYSVTATDSLGCVTSSLFALQENCYSTISGRVYQGDCVYNLNDPPMPFVFVVASGGGQTFFSITDENGNYSIPVNATGIYTVNFVNYLIGSSCITTCGNNQEAVIDSLPQSVGNINIGVNPGAFDLTLHPGWTSADPGFEKEYWVMPYNQSYYPFTGTATIVFTYDSSLVYDSSYAPLPINNPAAHTLTWVLDTLSFPTFNWNTKLISYFHVPASLPLSYQLQSEFYIAPTIGDCDTANNRMFFSETVVGSHDPNSKEVSPDGGLAETDSVLTYTINFQNTGTDTTNFIVITDTLSPYLNPATVVNIASSHPYSSFTITGNGVLTWKFIPVYLVDSTTNAPASKGFVMFTVKKIKNLPVGTTVNNKAQVYFDYNPAVVTNTVSSMINLPTLVSKLQVSGFRLEVYPNPTDGVVNIYLPNNISDYRLEAYDVLGTKLFDAIHTTQDAIRPLNFSGLAPGVYFIRVSTVTNTQTVKVVKD